MHAGTPESINPTHYECSVNLGFVYVCGRKHLRAHLIFIRQYLQKRMHFVCVLPHIHELECVGVNFMCVSVRVAVCVPPSICMRVGSIRVRVGYHVTCAEIGLS